MYTQHTRAENRNSAEKYIVDISIKLVHNIKATAYLGIATIYSTINQFRPDFS